MFTNKQIIEKQELLRKERIDKEANNFIWSLVPFGYQDINAAVETAMEAGHDSEWMADQVRDFMDETGGKVDDVDCNYVVYDGLLQEVRSDIEKLTDVDILNDTRHSIEVYGNAMCTSLDYSEEALRELIDILCKIDPDDYTDAIRWVIRELDIEDEVAKSRNDYIAEEEFGDR